MAEWNPWQEIQRLRHDIDRACEQVGWHNGGRNGHTFPTAFLPGRAARAYPLVNVSEDAHALYVTALAPGLDPGRDDGRASGLGLASEAPSHFADQLERCLARRLFPGWPVFGDWGPARTVYHSSLPLVRG